MQMIKIYPNKIVHFQSTHKSVLYLFKFVFLYWDVHFLPSVLVYVSSQVSSWVWRWPCISWCRDLTETVFHQKIYTHFFPTHLALVSIFAPQWSKYLTTNGLWEEYSYLQEELSHGIWLMSLIWDRKINT